MYTLIRLWYSTGYLVDEVKILACIVFGWFKQSIPPGIVQWFVHRNLSNILLVVFVMQAAANMALKRP